MDAMIELADRADVRSEIALSVRNLTKTYRIYARPEDRLKQALARNRRRYFEEHTAVDDVSFHVHRGETVGLVGRNGSGKSTVLQLIAGTLKPTSGSVKRQGRVAALLELGAGFNPDFTGRENARLNAAIFGMVPEEVDEIYPRVVEFADIGKYIDQPVKTYSSGMYVRLAFAAAVAVDPDILIVDEALSVGDAAFQRKCFSRIHEIQERGATILFVSHQTSSIIELCSRAMLMEGGKLLLTDKPKTVIGFYNRLLYDTGADRDIIIREIAARHHRRDAGTVPERETPSAPVAAPGPDGGPRSEVDSSDEESHYYDPNLVSMSRMEYASRGAVIHEPHIETLDGRRVNVLRRGCRYVYRFRVSFNDSFEKVRFGMFIRTTSGFDLGGSASFPPSGVMPSIDAGRTAIVSFSFDCLLLPGTYFMNAGASAVVDGERVFLHRLCDALMFRVMDEPDLACGGIVDFRIAPKVEVEEAL